LYHFANPTFIEVVRESWPSDCIDKKKLVDTKLPEYIVPSVPREEGVDKSHDSGDTEDRLQRGTIEGDGSRSRTNKSPQTKRAGLDSSSPSPVSKRHRSQSLSKDRNTQWRTPRSDESVQRNMDELDKLMEDSRFEYQAEKMISDYEDGSDSGHEAVPKKYRRGPRFDTFACMQAVGQDEDNPNRHTMRLLSMLQSYYENTGDQFRAISYRKAIITLRRQKKLIRNAKDALKIPGIGGSIAQKIEEAVNTGTIRKLENVKKEPRSQVFSQLLNIYGVGNVIAEKWYNQGVRSLEDVAKRDDLTVNQRKGLEHYEEFLERIPRDLVTEYYNRAIEPLKTIDPNAETYCMGSHRRGQMDCGDIDIILTKKGAEFSELQEIQVKWLAALFEEKFAKHTFGGGGPYDKRWLGAVALEDNKWRRLDILLVQDVSLGAALIYYTGNDIFNRSIRLLASKKGYHLNGEGLWLPKKDGEKKATTLIEARDEKKIFELLGVPYRLPTERNIG
jgi:DNA polymerase IV